MNSTDVSMFVKLQGGLTATALQVMGVSEKMASGDYFGQFGLALAISVASAEWFRRVQTVTEPYLDEVFHIPQAQAYCRNEWYHWDNKITTPPGLYVFSRISAYIKTLFGMSMERACSVGCLRYDNMIGMAMILPLSIFCRHKIELLHQRKGVGPQYKTYSWYSIQTGLNITLFPVLFFFSALYYTDVLSTVAVLLAYSNHLVRVGRERSSFASDLLTIILGVVALTMRQTNIFWVVVYMGGLEVVHAAKTVKPSPNGRRGEETKISFYQRLAYAGLRFAMGDVHDLPLSLAWPHNFFITIFSFEYAVVFHPIRVLRQVWPHIVIMGLFTGFVIWNDGVVLGDKSNHVATIHIPQMLYIWPLFAFFSGPLLMPSFVGALRGLLGLSSTAGELAARQTEYATNVETQSGALRILGIVFSPLVYRFPWFILVTYCFATAVVHNTIIHPFTLADNRHYMFYVFRYTILLSEQIRERLSAAYFICCWLCWATLGPCTDGIVKGYARYMPEWYGPNDIEVPASMMPASVVAALQKEADGEEEEEKEEKVDHMAVLQLEYDRALPEVPEPVYSSTAMLLFLATALSLVTAPLVEPRYFILPWVFWRLLVPSWRPDDPAREDARLTIASVPGLSWLYWLGRRFDLRVALETLWFVAINFGTMYMFLYRPYVWKNENGEVLDGGRLQRFMW